MWDKNAEKNQISSTSISNQLKKLENPILRIYLVSKAHKNKIPYVLGDAEDIEAR